MGGIEHKQRPGKKVRIWWLILGRAVEFFTGVGKYTACTLRTVCRGLELQALLILFIASYNKIQEVQQDEHTRF